VYKVLKVSTKNSFRVVKRYCKEIKDVENKEQATILGCIVG
jgi:hypothetical protein